ncbi:MAG TPA: 2OG-Fe(II) oxygenase [Pyrinomonadaceae bacterium]|nr:2OG-Fe(II) oxygenase [Pyrinomonadaceae bacterium]
MSFSDALLVQDGFLDAATCRRLLDAVNRFRWRVPLPEISRPSGRRPLCYSVIDGYQVLADLPEIRALHERTTRLVTQIFGDEIKPLADEQVACNVNITKPGGSYRYHYDRNALTAIVYLNETGGGETECYPNHRLRVPSVLQSEADRVFGNSVVRWMFAKQVLVRPRAGRLLMMRGNRCLHSVREVSGEVDRVNVVMSYDSRDARYANHDRLNSYLYTTDRLQQPRDPNYM